VRCEVGGSGCGRRGTALTCGPDSPERREGKEGAAGSSRLGHGLRRWRGRHTGGLGLQTERGRGEIFPFILPNQLSNSFSI